MGVDDFRSVAPDEGGGIDAVATGWIGPVADGARQAVTQTGTGDLFAPVLF
jgi:hypothetical protein